MSKSKSKTISDLRISPPEIHVGRFWCEVEYWEDGELRIKQFFSTYKRGAELLAREFVNKLLEN